MLANVWPHLKQRDPMIGGFFERDWGSRTGSNCKSSHTAFPRSWGFFPRKSNNNNYKLIDNHKHHCLFKFGIRCKGNTWKANSRNRTFEQNFSPHGAESTNFPPWPEREFVLSSSRSEKIVHLWYRKSPELIRKSALEICGTRDEIYYLLKLFNFQAQFWKNRLMAKFVTAGNIEKNFQKRLFRNIFYFKCVKTICNRSEDLSKKITHLYIIPLKQSNWITYTFIVFV